MLPSYPKLPSRASGKGQLPERSGRLFSDSWVVFELITWNYPATGPYSSNIILFWGSGCPGSEFTRKRDEGGTKFRYPAIARYEYNSSLMVELRRVAIIAMR